MAYPTRSRRPRPTFKGMFAEDIEERSTTEDEVSTDEDNDRMDTDAEMNSTDTNEETESIERPTTLPTWARALTSKKYTYLELKAFLKGQRPHEFNHLPNMNDLSFENWADMEKALPLRPNIATRLYFGAIRSPMPNLRENIYIYTGEKSDNRFGLVSGKDGRAVAWNEALYVEPVKPFWYLFILGRGNDEDERKRLRALTCFLFLRAGYLQTVGHYASFLDDLSNAVAYCGRGIEADSNGSTTGTSSNRSFTNSKGASAGSFNQKRVTSVPGSKAQSAALAPLPASKQSRTDRNEPTLDNVDNLVQLATKMKQSHDQFTQDMSSYQQEGALFTNNAQSQARLEQKLAQQAIDLASLSRQNDGKDKEIETLKKVARSQGELKAKEEKAILDINKQLDHWRRRATALEADRDSEKAKRMATEKKLEDIRKAQEAIAAMIGNPQK